MVFVLPNYRFFHVFGPLCIKVDSFGTVCYLFHDCSRTLQDSFMECYSTKYFSEKYCGCIQIFFFWLCIYKYNHYVIISKKTAGDFVQIMIFHFCANFYWSLILLPKHTINQIKMKNYSQTQLSRLSLILLILSFEWMFG